MISKTYRGQRERSKYRGHNMPNYTREQLAKWMLSQSNFERLYNGWVKSGYKRNLCPSVDRIDSLKPYTLDNIRLVTCAENVKKSCEDMRNGLDPRIYVTPVKQLSLNGKFIQEYHSQGAAYRATGVPRSSIYHCLAQNRKHAGGYVWKYADV